MKKEEYKNKAGQTRYRPVLTQRQYLNAEEKYIGFCINCGRTRNKCEPDARLYHCPGCKQEKVYGIPELLVMGIAKIV